ncbi:glutamine synthetase family protein [Kordiimonas aquimaris]|uniref:glutamine synthetase family protein n=1 Tax=Kordiimonas aquimaris TaxID=707591 RepID=UPI0021CE6A9C|nr:glutamine synthetase family protein [Kordiimonas aquimaris]
MNFDDEVSQFLARYPDTKYLDVLLPDINGIFRGKKVEISAIEKIAKGQFYFPITTAFLTTNGANAEYILDEYGSDPDRACVPISGSLQIVPWANRPTAQVMVVSQDADGTPLFSNPQSVVEKVLEQYSNDGLSPVVAFEYEFFLLDATAIPPKPLAPPNGMPASNDANCYNLDVYSDYEPLMQEIEEAAHAQGITVTGLVCEYGNGQFEVNLNHTKNILNACNEALLLKRVIKGVAHKYGLLASFMAKPLYDEVGNGLHAHVSILDVEGNNIFGGQDGEKRLKEALGGLLQTMPAATPFFAPNKNSYRRFDPEWFAPVVRNWGENNRRLSLRLPMSDTVNRRFEHRVSGADASPHLMLAAVLAGAHYGLKNHIDPGAPLGEFDLVDFDDVLPPRWKIALNTLREDTILADYMGADFIDLYLRIRESEEEEMHRQVPVSDYEQYLRIL